MALLLSTHFIICKKNEIQNVLSIRQCLIVYRDPFLARLKSAYLYLRV